MEGIESRGTYREVEVEDILKEGEKRSGGKEKSRRVKDLCRKKSRAEKGEIN